MKLKYLGITTLIAFGIWTSFDNTDQKATNPTTQTSSKELPHEQAKLNVEEKLIKGEHEINRILEEQVKTIRSQSQNSKKTEYNRKLSRFKTLSSKTLKSKEETKEWQNILSDNRFMDEVYLELTDTNSSIKPKQKIVSTMESIDLIAAAVSWKENPIRENLLQDASYLIKSDLILNTNDLALRKTIAGSQMELFLVLKEQSPSTAMQVRQDLAGTYKEEWLEFVDDHL
ncbi:MAG: hypothetical protein VX642_04395 [Bdellovibrionota bacterium]|nr:hypothetical protein [Bdellovibrionota bacterium]